MLDEPADRGRAGGGVGVQVAAEHRPVCGASATVAPVASRNFHAGLYSAV
ncbi:hypothetical protein [Mycolicibacterium insubricum]